MLQLTPQMTLNLKLIVDKDDISGVEPSSDQPACKQFDARIIETVSGYLNHYRQKIQRDFAFFTSSIHDKVGVHEEVDVDNLSFFLLQMPALKNFGKESEESSKLFYGVRDGLRDASTVKDLFYLLSEHTSFLDYQIYIDIAEKYNINVEEEKERYLCNLKEYVNKHSISELVEHKIIPTLRKESSNGSKKLVIKLDIKMSGKLAKLIDLKVAIAELLGFQPYALQLIYIEKGSVLVTFLVPAGAAACVFPIDKKFSKEESKAFRSLSVVWLEYDNCKFHFSAYDPHNIDGEEDGVFQYSLGVATI
jgi:hypothetical protein